MNQSFGVPVQVNGSGLQEIIHNRFWSFLEGNPAISKEYQRQRETFNGSYDRLQQVVPAERKADLLAVSDCGCHMEAEASDAYFRKGFFEGMNFTLQVMAGGGNGEAAG